MRDGKDDAGVLSPRRRCTSGLESQRSECRIGYHTGTGERMTIRDPDANTLRIYRIQVWVP
jgi:hypothetical protein